MDTNVILSFHPVSASYIEEEKIKSLLISLTTVFFSFVTKLVGKFDFSGGQIDPIIV